VRKSRQIEEFAMGKKDPRVDAYIAKARPFARPVLRRVRALVHKGCPDVREDIKWGFPHFLSDGILCSMASFRSHCAVGFWKGQRVLGNRRKVGGAMGQFGRIASVADLPAPEAFVGYVRRAAALNRAGDARRIPKKPRAKKPLRIPGVLRAALSKNARARAAFESFSPSNRRDYAEWIAEARTDATRARRLSTAIEWMEQGRIRNWKYARR
jgi:hypothetical protein